MDGQVIAECQILSVIVINILRKSLTPPQPPPPPAGLVGVQGTFCPFPTHYKKFRMLHFSMSILHSSLSNMKLILKAILDFTTATFMCRTEITTSQPDLWVLSQWRNARFDLLRHTTECISTCIYQLLFLQDSGI